jgi:hypothetical protein
VIAALPAKAVERGLTHLPDDEEQRLANSEGWIHVPRAGSREMLLS